MAKDEKLSWREWHRERAAPGVYCSRHVGHQVMYCDGCKRLWSPCCGETSPHPVDENLVKHLREQLATDPAAYMNAAKERATAARAVVDLTGRSGDGSFLPGEVAP